MKWKLGMFFIPLRDGPYILVVYIKYPPQLYLGGCQNYGPFLDPYYNMAPNM